jgi:Protein tyrosine and serine/threonine kinase
VPESKSHLCEKKNPVGLSLFCANRGAFLWSCNPGSVLINRDGNGEMVAGVADFGQAGESGETRTHEHDIAWKWAAPEHCANCGEEHVEDEFNTASDVFSFGVLMVRFFSLAV